MIPRWMNLVRAVSTEGFGRLRYYREIRRRLDADPQFAPFFEQETTKLPQFYLDMIRKDLGPMWRWLPRGALEHDPNAYLIAEASKNGHPISSSAPALWPTRGANNAIVRPAQRHPEPVA